MKKVLIIGVKYSNNLGDGVICECVDYFFSHNYETTIIDIYGRFDYPTIPSKPLNIKRQFYKSISGIMVRNLVLKTGIWPNTNKTKRKIKRLSDNLEQLINTQHFDAIVFAGGALFKGVFLNYIERIVNIAGMYRIPVFFNACGVDTHMLPVEWKHVYRILEQPNVRYLSLRDGAYSFRNIKYKSHIHKTFDTAIIADRIYKAHDTRSGIGLGIMLSHKQGFIQQVKFWTEIIKALQQSNFEWHLFTNGDYHDQAFGKYLLKLTLNNTDRLLDRPQKPQDLYDIISSFERIITMRLHSVIIAYSSRTPFVSIGWDPKVNEFCKKISCEKYCYGIDDDINTILSQLFVCENNQTTRKHAEDVVYNNLSDICRMIDE